MPELWRSLVSVLLLKDKIKHLPKYIIHSETFHWFCTVDTLRPISSGSMTAAAELPRGKGYLQSLGTTSLTMGRLLKVNLHTGKWGEFPLYVLFKGQQGAVVNIFLFLILLSGCLWWHDLLILSFFLKKTQTKQH